MKNFTTAILLAFFLGGFGAHHFYLRRYGLGVLYLCFCWTYIPSFLALLEIFFLKKRVANYNAKLAPAIQETLEHKPAPIQALVTAPSAPIQEKESYGLTKLPDRSLDPLHDGKRKIDVGHGLSLTIEYSTDRDSFYQDVLKYRNKVVKRANHQPFMTYWPTFSSLSKEQANWYFYWRHQVVNGHYPDTDLSYIFLFVYELMSYGFEPDPDKAISMLIQLNDAYKERHPKLNNYVSEWIGDLFTEGGRDDMAAEWYERSNNSHRELESLDRYNSPETFEKMPFRIWKKQMRLYRPTKFYEEHANLMAHSLKEALQVANEHYLESRSVSLIDHWFPKRKSAGIPLFRSAVISRKRTSLTRTEWVRTFTDAGLYELDAIIRFVENLVRQTKGVKRKIKVEVTLIPEGLRERLTQHFAPVPTSVVSDEMQEYKFDTVLIEQLQQDSQVIQEALLQENDPLLNHEEKPELEEELEEEMVNNLLSPDVAESAPLDYNPLAFMIGSGASPEIESFAAELGSVEREFLKMFTDEREPVDSCRDFCKKRGLMLSQFIDQINEKSLEHLGDNLLELIGDEYVVTEDFIDVIDEVTYEEAVS